MVLMDARTLLGGLPLWWHPRPFLLVMLLSDLAEVVAVAITPSAVAGVVTVGVATLADARAASLADVGTAFPADPAGVVTVGVASLADAGMVTVGVTD